MTVEQFEQAISLMNALGDVGNLLTGAGDLLSGIVEFGGSVSNLAAGMS